MAASRDNGIRAQVEGFLEGLKKKKPAERDIRRIIKMVTEAEGIQQSQAILDRYITKAQKQLDKLPESEGKQMLEFILDATFQ